MDAESRRSFLNKTAAALTTGSTASLAGCGSNGSDTGTQNDPSSEGDQEPKLNDVELMLSADDTADFTESEEYSLGLEAELTYTDGSTESRNVTDYEVENAEVRKTGEDGEYGVTNVDFKEFSDEDLRKAGHYQELEDLEIQDGQIILSSDDLITGYSQIDLDINVTDQEISEYIGDDTSYQNTVQVDKTEEQALQDLRVQGPEAIELWQKYREHRAEEILDNAIIAGSEIEDYKEFKQIVRERVEKELAEEDNPDLQTELGHWGTQFGREFMKANGGAAPSGGTHRLASILVDAVMFTSDKNVVPGVISDQGHNSTPVYVPRSNDPRDEEYWQGKTFNVNTQLEDAAHPPDQLVNYADGKFGIIFKRPRYNPSHAKGTFDSFMELGQELSGEEGMELIDEEYAISLTSELADDTEVWRENLQHIMETAVGNLFSTEHDIILSGSAEEPEVELK